jgi:hypothetical protein
MSYWVWPPLVVVYVAFMAVFSKWLNEDKSWRLLAYYMVVQALGFWPFVARCSKNLIFDGTLYDVITVAVYYGTLVYLGVGRDFSWVQWGGSGLVLLGLVLLKVG